MTSRRRQRRLRGLGPADTLTTGRPALAKESSDIAHEQAGLFHRREVSSAIEFRPMHDVVRPFRKASDRRKHLAAEHGDACWHDRFLYRSPGVASAAEFRVKAGRRVGG